MLGASVLKLCLWSLSFWVEDPRLERLGFRVMSGHRVTGSPGHRVMLSTAMQDLEMLSLSAQRLGNTAQRLCSNGVR